MLAQISYCNNLAGIGAYQNQDNVKTILAVSRETISDIKVFMGDEKWQKKP